jgi:serine protease Do
MSLRKTFLPAIALLLIPYGFATAQQTPAPATDAPGEFTFHFSGGSFLGIYTEEITRENMGRFSLSEPRGVAVSKVVEGSPAEKAGLKKGDVIIRFNGEEVTSTRKLQRQINEVAPEHTARMTISRGGAEQELAVTVSKGKGFYGMFDWKQDPDALKRLGELYGKQGFTSVLGARRRIGVSTSSLSKQLADFFGVAGGEGVLLTNITENSPAAKAGLKAGDVITEVDGEHVEHPADLSRAINRKTEGEITLTIVRDKSQRTIKVIPEKSDTMQLFDPDINITAPRIGKLNIPNIRVIPRIQTINVDAPRIEAKPRIRLRLRNQPI